KETKPDELNNNNPGKEVKKEPDDESLAQKERKLGVLSISSLKRKSSKKPPRLSLSLKEHKKRFGGMKRPSE
ncbi:MAG: hypothetical protein ACLFQV_08035, partial [Vulcanimicrobiota bacterium]